VLKRDVKLQLTNFFILALSSFLQHSFMSSSTDHSNLSHAMPYRTACLQYLHLTHIPPTFYLLFTRPRTLSSGCPLFLAFLFLSGDIELNPGPVSFTICTLNIRSILRPLHSAALSDLIDAHNPDLFCLTETWIKPTTTSAELSNSVVTVSKCFLSVGFGRFCRKNLGFQFGLGFRDKRIVNFFMTRVIWHDFHHR